jgi:hypothetical protein
MRYQHSTLMLAAAILIGCGDAQTTTAPTISPGTPTVTGPSTLNGTVVANQSQELLPALELRLADGSLIGLTGSGSLALASVVGAQVQISGLEYGDSMVDVQRFLVLSVGGQDVSDGILMVSDDGSYSLHLTSGGSRVVTDPPAELTAYLGERVWLVEADGAAPEAFGVIHA